jgi:hypothetical protein
MSAALERKLARLRAVQRRVDEIDIELRERTDLRPKVREELQLECMVTYVGAELRIQSLLAEALRNWEPGLSGEH